MSESTWRPAAWIEFANHRVIVARKGHVPDTDFGLFEQKQVILGDTLACFVESYLGRLPNTRKSGKYPDLEIYQYGATDSPDRWQVDEPAPHPHQDWRRA